MDENQTATPSVAPSSGAEGQNVETPSQTSTPAVAQKTGEEWQPEKNAKYVPYERFQEVVQGRNEIKEKLKAFGYGEDGFSWDDVSQLFQTYKGFDQVLNGNPQLFQAIMNLIQPNQNQAQPQQMPDTAQSLALDNYMTRFNGFCSEMKIPEETKPYVYQLAEGILLKMNPDPLRNYSMQHLNVALEHAKKFLESVGKANLASYVQTKPNNNVPASASSGGSAPTPAPKPLANQGERAAAMAQMLRAGTY